MRSTYYKRGDTKLVTPDGDGTLVRTLVHRLGMDALLGNRSNIEIITRIYKTLDRLVRTGVVSEWSIQGRERVDPFETKLEIIGSESYAKAYEISGLKAERDRLSKQLAAPFAPERRRKGRKR